MEMHQIRYFLAVAQTGSFTRAARQCAVSQPSLSVQVAKLEDELGGILLDRSRQGVRLTARGEVFLPRALEIMGQLDSARQQMDEMSGLGRGTVRLGCMPTTGAYLLPRILNVFRKRFPGIRIELLESSSPGLVEALTAHHVELAIVDDGALSPAIQRELLFKEPLFLVLPAGHVLAGKKNLRMKQVADQSFILLKKGNGFRRLVDAILQRASLHPEVVYESTEIETVQALVESGMGVSVVPEMVRKKGALIYVPISDRQAQRQIFLAERKTTVLSAAALALKQVIVNNMPAED